MKYMFVTFNPSMEIDSPGSWYKRTESYAGVMYCLAGNNTVINIKQINYEGEQMHNGVQFHFVSSANTYFPWKLISFIKKQQPDIVFVQGLHNPLQLIQLCARLDRRTKIIIQHHAEKPSIGIKKRLQKIACKQVDAFLFASHELGAEWVKSGIIPSMERVHEVMELSSIFKPMDKTAALAKTGATGQPVFLWVGRLNANKAPLTVVKAFLRFAELHPSAKLNMIYHTEELLGEVNEILNKSPQKDAIKLIGKVPHDELQYWFSSADVLISGSYYEGSGTAVCEAMSCGCVPLVTDIPSFRMITDKGRCGFLYEPGNENALLSVLLQTQEIDLEGKRQVSLEYFKSNLSFEGISARIQEIASAL